MKNVLDSSDADLQTTDELFAQDISSEVMTISAATDRTDRLPEQRIVAQSMVDLRSTFSRQSKRMQRSHAAQLGRPEFLEVRSLLSGDSLTSFTQEELALIESAGPWQLTTEDTADLKTIFGTTDEEQVMASIVADFHTIPAGNLQEGQMITIPDIGDAKVYRGGFTPISVTADGGLQTGANSGHLTMNFTKPTFVTSFSVQKVSGSGSSLYNTGTGYSDLNGSQTIMLGKEISGISIVVRADDVYKITGITVPSLQTHQVQNALPSTVQEYVDQAAAVALNQSSFRSLNHALSTVIDTLNELPRSTPQVETVLEETAIDFHTISAGNLPDGKAIMIPSIGEANVYTGGSTPISVTADGGLQTGANGGHLVLNFTKPTFVTSFTVQKVSGSGSSLYYTDGGYKALNGSQTITVGKEISGIWIVVRSDDVYKITGITVPLYVERTVKVGTPAELLPIIARLEDQLMIYKNTLDTTLVPLELLKAGEILLTQIDTLSAPWNLEGQGNRQQLLSDRGTSLSTAVQELTVLGEDVSRTQNMASENLQAELQSLSERIPAAALKVGGAVSEWQTEQSLFDTHAWQLLSAASRERLFTNNAPERPVLSVVNLSGPNVTLFFTGSTEGRTLRLKDMGSPGELGSKTVVATHDDEQQTATVTINAQNPSGTYAVQLLDAQMRIIGSLPLHWNQDTKVLSLTDASHAFAPTASIHDDGSLSYEELFTRAKSEEDAQIMVAGPAAAKEQLFSGVATAIPVGFVPDFNMNYSKIFKEQAQLQLLDLVARSGVNFTLTSEQMRYAFFEFNPEYKRVGDGGFEADKGVFLGQFVQKCNGYYQNVALLLQKTMDCVLAARQGKNIDTPEYWRGLHTILDKNYYGQQLAAAAMAGIAVADVTTMLRAVEAIYDEQFDAFLAFQDATYTAMINKQNEFKNWQPAVTKEGSSNSHNGMNAHESERMLRAQVKARDAAIARGVTGDALQMYNRGIMLAENNHQKVLSGTTVYAYGVPESAAKHNFETVLESEGTGTVAERAAAYLKANPEARQYLAGLAGAQQEDIAMRYLAAYPDDNTIIDSLSVGVQDEVRSTLARAKSITVAMAGEMDIAWWKLVEIVEGESISGTSTDLNILNGVCTASEPLFMSNRQASREIHLDQNSMASFWTDAPRTFINGVPGVRNISISIEGPNLKTTYTSDHSTTSGESISLQLTAGDYTVTVTDLTTYPNGQEPKSYVLPMGVDITPYNSAQITGRISIENSSKTMLVSMRVAEFDDVTGKRKTDYKNVSELKTDKPVWVVVHGRNDRDDSAKMIELEKALTQSGYQVVTIDWREAAQSFAGVQGEKWIQAVGDWGFRALVGAGIDGSNIRMGVHSWGSWVGNVIAEHYHKENGFGVDTIVALDSAIDPTLSHYYDASAVNLSNVSKNSIAFWSSGFGSKGRAFTAEHTVELRSPAVSATPIYNQVLRHGMAVTTVANLVRLKNIDPTNAIASRFAWSSNEYDGLPRNAETDTWMYVDAYREFYQNGSTEEEYIDAIPTRMTFGNPDDEVEDLFLYNEVRNLQ